MFSTEPKFFKLAPSFDLLSFNDLELFEAANY
jgi:hypothetical protein